MNVKYLKLKIMNYTNKVNGLIATNTFTIASMAEYLGISRPTLYTRLVENNWKKGEIALLRKL